LYDYYPSFAAAVVFAVVFGMLTIAHITQAAVFKKVSLRLSSYAQSPMFRSLKLTGNGNAEILLGTHNGMYLGNHLFHSSIIFNSTPTKRLARTYIQSLRVARTSL
jgi:hypothetical protein